MSNQLPSYLTKVCLRPRGQLWGHLEHNYYEEKPSQSHFEAEKLLRRRRCRIISGSSGRPFRVPFSLNGSRDLEEHDQISLVSIWHCSDVLLRFWTEIKKPPPQRQRPGDVGNVMPNSVINPLVMVWCLLLHFRSTYVYMDVIIPLIS